MILLPEGIIPLLIVYVPELVLRIIRARVQPFLAAQVADFVLETAVLGDELGVAVGGGRPEAEVEEVVIFLLLC